MLFKIISLWIDYNKCRLKQSHKYPGLLQRYQKLATRLQSSNEIFCIASLHRISGQK